MAEVAQQPPEPFRTAHVPVGDDEDPVADSGSGRRACEVVGVGKGMPSAWPGRRGEVIVDVEERRPRDVSLEVQLTPATGRAELPAAVDELVARHLTACGRDHERDGPELNSVGATERLQTTAQLFSHAGQDVLVEA